MDTKTLSAFLTPTVASWEKKKEEEKKAKSSHLTVSRGRSFNSTLIELSIFSQKPNEKQSLSLSGATTSPCVICYALARTGQLHPSSNSFGRPLISQYHQLHSPSESLSVGPLPSVFRLTNKEEQQKTNKWRGGRRAPIHGWSYVSLTRNVSQTSTQ